MVSQSSSIRGFIIYCSVLVVAVFIQTACANNDEYEDVKMKRGGTVGLFPFPRVGRSDPELSNWEPATAALLNSLEDYNDLYRAEAKRQGLMPFPRVGRSGYKPVWFPSANHASNSRMQKRNARLD